MSLVAQVLYGRHFVWYSAVEVSFLPGHRCFDPASFCNSEALSWRGNKVCCNCGTMDDCN